MAARRMVCSVKVTQVGLMGVSTTKDSLVIRPRWVAVPVPVWAKQTAEAGEPGGQAAAVAVWVSFASKGTWVLARIGAAGKTRMDAVARTTGTSRFSTLRGGRGFAVRVGRLSEACKNAFAVGVNVYSPGR